MKLKAHALVAGWAIAIGMCCSPAIAEMPDEYSRMGQRAIAAFECSVLAADHKDDQDRLLALGLDEGKKFVEAFENDLSNSQTDPATSSADPATEPSINDWKLAFTLGLASGIAKVKKLSPDFALGYTFALLVDEMTKEVDQKAGPPQYRSEASRREARATLFDERNCKFLLPNR